MTEQEQKNKLSLLSSEFLFNSYPEYNLVYLTSSDRILELNESGKVIIESIKEGLSINNIAQKISSRYNVNESETYQDVIGFISILADEIESGYKKWNSKTSIEYFNKYMEYFSNNNIVIVLLIDITQRCNLHCKHCYYQDLPNNTNEMSYEEIVKAIQICGKDALKIVLSGGEPFIRSDIYDIIEYINKSSFSLEILTNATLLDINKLKIVIKNPKTVKFGVSLYSLDENIHDSFVGATVHKKVIKNIKQLKEYYRVTIKTPILNININEIENIKEFCIQENMGFAPDYRITRTISGNSKPLQYKADWDSIEELSKKGIIKISNEYKCLASRSKIKISASGEIYPCEILPISLGNIRDKKFNEIINSEKANFIRKSISEERNECIKCEANGKCTFCLGASFLENGDINKISNDYCEISKKMVNLYNEEEKK